MKQPDLKSWIGRRIRLRGSKEKGRIHRLSCNPKFVLYVRDQDSSIQKAHFETLILLKPKKKCEAFCEHISFFNYSRITNYDEEYMRIFCTHCGRAYKMKPELTNDTR